MDGWGYGSGMSEPLTAAVHIVRAAGGEVHGAQLQTGGCRFLGIPYATADRLGAPQPIDAWAKPIQARAHGPICPQTPGLLESMLGGALPPMAEDCLSLNVFTPTAPQGTENLPVLFWIHGGAFTNGAGSIPWYDGSHLAGRGTVVVTINYRLGALGYLGSSNLGTLDQLAALRWVSKNIASFGGNPGNVTIFGESAGGAAVVSLLASPDARDLFHRAWAMSPSIGQLRSRARAAEVERQFVDAAGITTLADVSSMPLEEVLAAQNKVLSIPSDGYDIFSPVAGGSALPENILDAAAQSPVPFVIGTTRDENKLFSMLDPNAANKSQDDWVKFTDSRFGSRAATARDIYGSLRPGESPAALISAVLTDVGFRQRAQRLAEHRARLGSPTWMYWFTWQSPAFGGVLGSCHALDIPFAFDNLDAPGTEMLTGDGADRHALADRFAGEIVRLAHHGHPGWGQFNLATRDTLVLDSVTDLTSDPEPEIRSLYC